MAVKDWDSIDIPKYGGARNKRIERHFGYKPNYAANILKHVMNEDEVIESYKHELRISKLPYCGLVDAVELLEKEPRIGKYAMRFYTSQGTALHENIQNSFSYSKKYGSMVIGRWKCSHCKHIYKKVGPMPNSGMCTKCRSNYPTLEYHELDFTYKNKVTGHLDQLTLDKKEQYVAWEYKTTGENNVHEPERYLPYPKHIIQIETYCALLEVQYGIVPKAFYIIYLNRNKVQQDGDSTPEFVVFGFKVKRKNLQKRIAHLDSVVESDSIITDILHEPTKENIKQLENLRPCRSRKDYDDFMAHHFFGDTKCPFVDGETCFLNRSQLTEAGMKIFRTLNKKNSQADS